MTAYTSPDNLPYPDDYQQPADSPSAFRALAEAAQAAISATKAYALARITQNWGSNTDVAVSQNTVTSWKNAIEARTISAGTGLTGGGSLAASRTLAVDESRIATRAYAQDTVVPLAVEATKAELRLDIRRGRVTGTYLKGGQLVTYGGPAFVNIPSVVLTNHDGLNPFILIAQNPQRTGFTLRVYGYDGIEPDFPVDVSWIAMEGI